MKRGSHEPPSDGNFDEFGRVTSAIANVGKFALASLSSTRTTSGDLFGSSRPRNDKDLSPNKYQRHSTSSATPSSNESSPSNSPVRPGRGMISSSSGSLPPPPSESKTSYGSSPTYTNSNKPISLLSRQTITVAGLNSASQRLPNVNRDRRLVMSKNVILGFLARRSRLLSKTRQYLVICLQRTWF